MGSYNVLFYVPLCLVRIMFWVLFMLHVSVVYSFYWWVIFRCLCTQFVDPFWWWVRGCFQHLAVRIKLLWTCSYKSYVFTSLRKMPGSGMGRSENMYIVSFIKSQQIFPKVAVGLLRIHQQEFRCPALWSAICVVRSFNFRHLVDVLWSLVWFQFVSLS